MLSIFRKTHHESWTGLSSTKERFPLEQKYVKKYMLGKASAVDILLSQFREKWMKEKEKKKKKKMMLKESQLQEALQDDTEKIGDHSKRREKDGEISQEDEKQRRREAKDEVSVHHSTSGEINREKKEGEWRDEKERKIKRTEGDDSMEQKDENEEEEEVIDTEFFKDSKNHKSLQLAIEVQDAIATHGLVPMVSEGGKRRHMASSCLLCYISFLLFSLNVFTSLRRFQDKCTCREEDIHK